MHFFERSIHQTLSENSRHQLIFKPGFISKESYLIEDSHSIHPYRKLAVFKHLIKVSLIVSIILFLGNFITAEHVSFFYPALLSVLCIQFIAFVAYKFTVTVFTAKLQIHRKANIDLYVDHIKSYPRIIFILIFYGILPIIMIVLCALSYHAMHKVYLEESSLDGQMFMIIVPMSLTFTILKFVIKHR